MYNIELGQEANAIYHDNTKNEFKTISGIVTGYFCDPNGRQFVQIKPRDGHSANVDLITVNADSETRQKYMDVMETVKTIETDGNKRLEEIQAEIIEESNLQINNLFATLTPLIDLSFDDDPLEEEAEGEVVQLNGESVIG